MRFLWYVIAFVLSALLLAVHVEALNEYLYFQYLWLDIPVHFLGGLVLGMFFIAPQRTVRPKTYLLLVAAALIGWEVFEYLIGVRHEEQFLTDTSLDIVMGALGALVAYMGARKTLWRSA